MRSFRFSQSLVLLTLVSMPLAVSEDRHDSDGYPRTTVVRHSEGHTTTTTVHRFWTPVEKDGFTRFLENPEVFLQDEKSDFLKNLRAENPKKAREIEDIFTKYEGKLKELKKKTSEKSLEELLQESKVRGELSQLERDIHKVFDAVDNDLRPLLDKLKEKSISEFNEADWRELINNLSDSELRQEANTSYDDIKKQSQDFEDLKRELQGKPLEDIAKDKLRELVDRSRNLRSAEERIRDQIKRIEKDLGDQGLLGEVKRAVEAAVKDTKSGVDEGKAHLDSEVDKVKTRLNRLFK